MCCNPENAPMPKFRRATLVAIAVLLALTADLSLAQSPNKRLTNNDIIDMTALGLADDVVIAKIRSVSGADGLLTPRSTD
jgi:hypothetical protein